MDGTFIGVVFFRMNAKTNALKTKKNNNALLSKVFKSGAKVAGKGKYVLALGKSKSGPCKICKQRAGSHNIGSGTALPPYHPHCKCQIH